MDTNSTIWTWRVNSTRSTFGKQDFHIIVKVYLSHACPTWVLRLSPLLLTQIGYISLQGRALNCCCLMLCCSMFWCVTCVTLSSVLVFNCLSISSFCASPKTRIATSTQQSSASYTHQLINCSTSSHFFRIRPSLGLTSVPGCPGPTAGAHGAARDRPPPRQMVPRHTLPFRSLDFQGDHITEKWNTWSLKHLKELWFLKDAKTSQWSAGIGV